MFEIEIWLRHSFLTARPGWCATLPAADGPDKRRQIETQRSTFADRRPAEDAQRSGFRRPHSATAAGRIPIPAATDTFLLPTDPGQQSK